MPERGNMKIPINQLIKKAGFTGFDLLEGRKEMLVEFAELIIKECADTADMAHEAGCPYPGDYIVEAMGFGEECGAAEWRCK